MKVNAGKWWAGTCGGFFLLPFLFMLASPVAAAGAVLQQEGDVALPSEGSLLFSPIEIAAIQRALAGKVSGTEALHAKASAEAGGSIIPLRRSISLSGVIWRGKDSWTIWLNGQKVTPEKLLPEIVDIKVEKEKVTLKWFDIGINGVILISLHPHQTYDIVTGVLLPG